MRPLAQVEEATLRCSGTVVDLSAHVRRPYAEVDDSQDDEEVHEVE